MPAIRAFVSSTYRDLREHRAYVIDRLARSGIVVDPMERWTAATDAPKTFSVDRVRDCDLCVLLVGFRRGHVPEGEKLSITQLEFREALRRGIDVLVFLANEEADWSMEAVAPLQRDREAVRWRADLMERKGVGPFGPRPESIDIDSAVFRWMSDRQDRKKRFRPGSASGNALGIDIRAYGNSEGALVVWRVPEPIEGCLGFALRRRVLGDADVGPEEDVPTRLSFMPDAKALPEDLGPGTQAPIQTYRWMDRGEREVRYRVVPVVGTPGNLRRAEESGSAWTAWISPGAGEEGGKRAFFNFPRPMARIGGVLRNPRGKSEASVLRGPGRASADRRAYLGGSLRRTLIETLVAARLTGQRAYAALSRLDDPDLIDALGALGPSLEIVVASPPLRGASRGGPAGRERANLCRAMRGSAVRVYEEPRRRTGAARSHFIVLCDRWGSPQRVWTGSAAWTTESLCLRWSHGALLESTPAARAYLDLWGRLRNACDPTFHTAVRRRSAHVHLREQGIATTLWNTPVHGEADLRDVRRLIRGARQGVLFLADGDRFSDALMSDIRGLLGDEDLFIEGLRWSRGGGRGSRHRYEFLRNGQSVTLTGPLASPPVDGTLLVVDPFGPHPVAIFGSHDLGSVCSGKDTSDLLVIENSPSLAIEFAVHLLGLFDRYRWRAAVASLPQSVNLLLHPSPDWQKRYFAGPKRSEFNFLFGALSPGL